MLCPVAGEGAAGLCWNVVVRRITQGCHGAAGGPFHLGGAEESEVVDSASRAVGHDVTLDALSVDAGSKMLGMHPGEGTVVLGSALGCTQNMTLAATRFRIGINGAVLPAWCCLPTVATHAGASKQRWIEGGWAGFSVIGSDEGSGGWRCAQGILARTRIGMVVV